MVLSNEDIEKFQILYKKQYGIEISAEQAREEGMKLIRLITLVYGPEKETKKLKINSNQ